MDNKTIGVLLPVYRKDKPEYLSLAVSSILNQSYADFILFLGVDGPVDDNLSDTIDQFEKADSRVRPIRFPENRGLAVVLNDLINICQDNQLQFIARMDADDVSLPLRFERQMKFLSENPDIDVVGGAISEIDENGNSRNKTIIYPLWPDECRAFFARRNPHAHPAVMFRRRFFDKIGHAYRPEYRQNQDTMLWLDGFAANTLNANLPDIVLNFRMTESLFKKRRNGWKFAKKQFRDRRHINRTLGYGFSADLFGLAMFILQLSPTWMRKAAYKVFR